MTIQTCFLFDIPVDLNVAGFVFSGTVCSYNFHWFLTPPHEEDVSEKITWNLSNKNLHLILFLSGLIGGIVFSILLIEHWFWLGTTALFTFLYSAPKVPFPAFGILKKIAIGKTIFLAFAWTHVTTLLPLLIAKNVLTDGEIWFFVKRFFFIYAICILFDYRDQEEDRKAGIRSMITYLDEKGIDILFWGSILVVLISSFLLSYVFTTAMLLALLLPVLILGLLYYPSKRNFSDYLYYFILDGLMMLSAPLLLLIKFAR